MSYARPAFGDHARHAQGRIRTLAPGVCIAFVIAMAATFLGNHYGAPVMLFALLIGLALHFLSQAEPCAAGIEFCAKSLLRVGIALLGARITFDQLAALGAGPLILVLICILATIGFGLLAARLLGRGWRLGILTGGAVAICGASAALAISAVLPRHSNLERDTLFTVIAVTTLSTIAMVAYPILFSKLGLSDQQIGVLLGASIHDVAQVVGAGYAVSEEAGDTASYVKLLRVAMLPIVVIVLGVVLRAKGSERQGAVPVPLFTLGFAGLVIVNSFGLVPEPARLLMVDSSRWLLVAAIAALGVKTSMSAMFRLGPRHSILVVAQTGFLAALAVALLFLLQVS